ncbi:MAG: hypothetical protein ACPG5B_02315 [Chitinophagales bacterium]
MNQILWKNIEQFSFDTVLSDYGFETRLASENAWTKKFTKKALLEYKKFMYLAATSNTMVSPSEIVDIVWHQHLIFSKSYREFCQILGKNVQHIPSTHNEAEFETFQKAKMHTTRLYKENFGEQPKEIWEYRDMYAPLGLRKAKIDITVNLIIGLIAFFMLANPAYYLLLPTYQTIGNPLFLQTYVIFFMLAFVFLNLFNQYYLANFIKKAPKFSFLHHLEALELIYMKTKKLDDVIHANLNKLLHKKTITVNSDDTLKLQDENEPKNVEEYATFKSLQRLGNTYYPVLLKELLPKPTFQNVANSVTSFRKHFTQSKFFMSLFSLNLICLTVLLMLGFVRLLAGINHQKPILFISMTMFVFTVATIYFLWRLTQIAFTRTIPQFYISTVLPKKQQISDLELSYFVIGSSILAADFLPLVTYTQKNNSAVASSCGTCGSSCGSSCGGGCGGGCGGCGG